MPLSVVTLGFGVQIHWLGAIFSLVQGSTPAGTKPKGTRDNCLNVLFLGRLELRLIWDGLWYIQTSSITGLIRTLPDTFSKGSKGEASN